MEITEVNIREPRYMKVTMSSFIRLAYAYITFFRQCKTEISKSCNSTLKTLQLI